MRKISKSHKNERAREHRDEEGDEGTQAANINELFDYSLELLWTLVTKNGWDQTKLPGNLIFTIKHIIHY